jgi:hypothetical protein
MPLFAKKLAFDDAVRTVLGGALENTYLYTVMKEAMRIR